VTEKLSDERLAELRRESEQSARAYLTAAARARDEKEAGTAEICENFRQMYVDLVAVIDEAVSLRAQLEAEMNDNEQLRAWRYNSTAGSYSLRMGEAEKLTRALDSKVRADASDLKLNRIRELATLRLPDGDRVVMVNAARILDILDGEAGA